MRWILVITLCFAALPTWADETEAPQPMSLKGTSAVITPPGEGFRHVERTPAPGEWTITFKRSGGGLELEARVFQDRPTETKPEPMLVQSLDTLSRLRGFDGFGIPSNRAIRVWGLPGAEGTFQAAIDGKVSRGLARVLKISDHQWAFVWGLASGNFKASDLATIRAFIESLEPKEPAFFTRRFKDEALLAKVLTAEGEEPPVNRGDIEAAAAIIEHGLGHRLALAHRAMVVGGLLADVRAGDERTRQNYVAVGGETRKAMKLDPISRQRVLSRRGLQVLVTIGSRMAEGWRPAVQTMIAVNRANRPALPVGEDGPTVSAIAAHIEMAVFLASVAADEDVVADVATTARLLETLKAGWDELDLTEQIGIIEIGTTWAALRHAWDSATDDARLAYRQSVALALAPESEHEAIEALEGPRAIKRYLSEHRSEARTRSLVDAASALSVTDRSLLFLQLGVESEGYQFGW